MESNHKQLIAVLREHTRARGHTQTRKHAPDVRTQGRCIDFGRVLSGLELDVFLRC